MSESIEAKSHDYPLYGFDLTWRDGAYRVSVPNLLKEGERLHVVPATALTELEGKCRERISELEETLAETLDYLPDYFREKWKLDDPLKKGAGDV